MLDPRKIAKELRRNGVELVNRKAVRQLRGIHYSINEKSDLAHQIARVREDGRVGISVSGMDCDCTQFSHQYIRDLMPLVAEFAWLEREYQGAEGPLSIYYLKPSQTDDGHRESRDLALEAFEDGHSHVVYY